MFRVNQLAGFGVAKAGAPGWTPAQLPGLSFWYDPAYIATLFQDSAGTTAVAADGDPVGLMNDISGNSHHISQTTSGARPTWKAGSGLPYLDFDGVGTFLTRSETNIGIGTAIIGCYFATGNPVYSGILSNTIDGGADIDAVFGRNGALDAWYTNDAFQAGDFLADTNHFWNNKSQTVNISIDTIAVYSSDGTGNANTLRFPNGVQVGFDRNNVNRYFKGRIYGVIGTTGILSGTDRNLAETWMGGRCGLSI